MFFSEKPHDVEWNALEKQKIPILLNFAQCKLMEEDFYAVIEHCTSVIQSDNGIKNCFLKFQQYIFRDFRKC